MFARFHFNYWIMKWNYVILYWELNLIFSNSHPNFFLYFSKFKLNWSKLCIYFDFHIIAHKDWESRKIVYPDPKGYELYRVLQIFVCKTSLVGLLTIHTYTIAEGKSKICKFKLRALVLDETRPDGQDGFGANLIL